MQKKRLSADASYTCLSTYSNDHDDDNAQPNRATDAIGCSAFNAKARQSSTKPWQKWRLPATEVWQRYVSCLDLSVHLRINQYIDVTVRAHLNVCASVHMFGDSPCLTHLLWLLVNQKGCLREL